MLTILQGIFTAITATVIVMADSIFSFIGGLYASTKVSLGIAVPLVGTI